MIGVRCEVRKEDEWEDGGVCDHWLRGVDYKSYKGGELLDRDCQWWEGRMIMREHTMELLLDDVVRVLELLMLRGKWIGGMKELIYSILHDWVGSVQASAWANSIPRTLNLSFLSFPFQNTPKHHVHHPSLSLSSPRWRQSCTSLTLSPLFLFGLTIQKKNSQSCRSQRNLHSCKCAHNYKVNKGRPHHQNPRESTRNRRVQR